jgi:hypothetical protein
MHFESHGTSPRPAEASVNVITEQADSFAEQRSGHNSNLPSLENAAPTVPPAGGSALPPASAGFSGFSGTYLPHHSPLSSFVDQNGIPHVFYVDANWHVRELYELSGHSWQPNDLTAATNSPVVALYSSLTSYFDNRDASQHVFYIDAIFHVRELYNFGPGWRPNDLTAATNSPPTYQYGGLTSFFDKNSVQHVFYVDGNGHVQELYEQPGAVWNSHDLTAATNSPQVYTDNTFTSLTSFFDNSRGIQHVLFVDANMHLRELYQNPGDPWHSHDLTDAHALPSGTPLTE